MKNLTKFFYLPLLALLSSCVLPSPAQTSSHASTNTSEKSSGSSLEHSSNASSTESEYENGTYHFYCVNDMHGSVLERGSGYYYEAGVAKYFGRLKQLKDQDPEHTIILSAGDMYQGSLESNFNYGALITDAMNAVPFDAMTVGNHEFDWGVDHLLDNVERANFPVLGGNIMRYDPAGSTTPWNRDKFGISTIIQRGKNKIGIVGMIGEGQTKSITSKNVEDMDFVRPEQLAKNEALRLRNEEGCSMVILVIHDSYYNSTFAADKTYFDGVFNGHSHSWDSEMISGVPFVQSGCNTRSISYFELVMEDGVCACSTYNTISSSNYWSENQEIAAIRDSYLSQEQYASKATAVAGTVNGYLSTDDGIPCIIEKAIWSKYIGIHPEITLTMCNSQRATLSGEITYSDIYKATPFSNKIVIANVKGSDIHNEVRYNHIYSENTTSYDDDAYYTVAIIDYILYHQDTSKRYDYFQSLNEDRENKFIAEYETYPYDLLFDYIHDDLGGIVNPEEFTSGAPGFDRY